MKTIRVLFVEDNLLDAELLIRHIQKGEFEIKYDLTTSLEEMSVLIEKNKYDICICDYRLPGFSGIDALKKIQKADKDIPVILASGTIPDEQAIDAVLAGAKDYVLKDNLQRLMPAIEREIEALTQRREKKKSDRLLKAVFDSSVGVRVSDEDRIIVKVNDAYCDMMGYTKEELIGKSIDILIPESRIKESRARYSRLLRRHKSTGSEQQVTKRDVHKDGSYIDVLVKTNIYKEDDNQYVVSCIQDVSEVFKYKTLFEESGRIAKLGGWERDIATGKEVWTKQIYDIYNVTEETFDPKKQSDARFHTEKSLKLMKTSMKEAEEKGIPFDIEVEIIDANGVKKWCRGTGNPIFEKGKVVKLIGSFQDITDQKEKELELKRNEEKYKFLFELSPNPMLIFELESDKIIDTNLAAESFYGYSKKEFKTMKAVDLRAPENVEQYFEVVKDRAFKSSEIRTYRSIKHRKKNGEEIVVDIYSRLTTINGKKASIVVINDITEKFNTNRNYCKLIIF